MNATFQRLPHPTPPPAGAAFVMNTCCENGKLSCEGDFLVYSCPDHLLVYLRDGQVVHAQTLGSRS